jgi:ubiquinone/menaquinone biosynthesis C-methylase UbiE
MASGLSDEEKRNLEAYSSADALKEFDAVGLTRLEKELILKYFQGNRRILDIGCGIGRTTFPLHQMKHIVTGVDISAKMIEKAKIKFPDLDFRVGNACELEFENSSFDGVLFSYNGIDYIYPEERRMKALREINRVLTDNGILIFSSHNSRQLISKNRLFHLWLLRFLIINAAGGKLFSKYKIDKNSFGEVMTYFINPQEQRQQLNNTGFEMLETAGNFKNKLRYLEPWPYYVARKVRNKPVPGNAQ